MKRLGLGPVLQGALVAALMGTLGGALLAPGAVWAQSAGLPSNYNVQHMNFDLWCQETQRLAYERCAERRAEDVKAFESYRDTVESYELEYLKDQQRQEQLDSNILNKSSDLERHDPNSINPGKY